MIFWVEWQCACVVCVGKVFSKLGYNVSDDVLQKVAENKPHFVEYLLVNLKIKIEHYLEQQQYNSDYIQPHPMATLYKQEPNETYQQEEYRHHQMAVPLNSNKSSNSYQTDYSVEGEAYHNALHQQAITGARPSQLPVPIGNKLTFYNHSGAQYNTKNPSQIPTLPPIVLSSHAGKKGFSASDRSSKYKKPSSFW